MAWGGACQAEGVARAEALTWEHALNVQEKQKGPCGWGPAAQWRETGGE